MNIKEVQARNNRVKSNSQVNKLLDVVKGCELPPAVFFDTYKQKRINAMQKIIDDNKIEYGEMFDILCDIRPLINTYGSSFISARNDNIIPVLARELLWIVLAFEKAQVLFEKYKTNQDLNQYYKGLVISRGKFNKMLINDLDFLANEHGFKYDKSKVKDLSKEN